MGTRIRFIDQIDGLVKWGELSQGFNANNPKIADSKPLIPIVIEQFEQHENELRFVSIDMILEEI